MSIYARRAAKTFAAQAPTAIARTNHSPPSHGSASLSSLPDSLSDLLRAGRSPSSKRRRKDELDARDFEVIRLNDTRTAGTASLLDAISGPAAGDAAREAARRKRVERSWRDLLSSLPAGNPIRDGAASALRNFERKESERRERLVAVLDDWRDRQAASEETEKGGGGWWRYFARFGKDKKASPKKIMAQQLDNEAELFKALGRCGVDLETVGNIVAGASSMMGSTSVAETDREDAGETEPKDQKDSDDGGAGCVYVLDFKGDTRASKTKELSQEISAVLSLPPSLRPSEVILRLKSPGGTVSGYGLCAAELRRIKTSGAALTVCVDEVAASGGYLAASVADRIYAAPLAAIGSIGVVASTPNVARRLGDEGVEVVQATAGKYKRTVTPWREPSEEELEKLQEDVDAIHEHFVRHVAEHRSDRIPDVREVATGEVWYGPDALSRGLVDDLLTSEEYIQRQIGEGRELFLVKKVSKGSSFSSLLRSGLNRGDSFLSGVGTWSLPMLRDATENSKLEVFQRSGLRMLDGGDCCERDIDEFVEHVASLPSGQRQALVKAVLQAHRKDQ